MRSSSKDGCSEYFKILYFVLSCIVLFFISLNRDVLKKLSLPQINKQHLQTVKERFQAFLSGDTQIVADEAFINAVQSYYEVSCKQIITLRHNQIVESLTSFPPNIQLAAIASVKV